MLYSLPRACPFVKQRATFCSRVSYLLIQIIISYRTLPAGTSFIILWWLGVLFHASLHSQDVKSQASESPSLSSLRKKGPGDIPAKKEKKMAWANVFYFFVILSEFSISLLLRHKILSLTSSFFIPTFSFSYVNIFLTHVFD